MNTNQKIAKIAVIAKGAKIESQNQ